MDLGKAVDDGIKSLGGKLATGNQSPFNTAVDGRFENLDTEFEIKTLIETRCACEWP
jgi:hypothetical protein